MNFTIRLPKLFFTALLLVQLFTLNAQKKAEQKEDFDLDWVFNDYPGTATTTGTAAKIKNSYAIWTDFDLRKKADAAAFKSKVGADLFEQIANNCNETSGWPGAISNYEERNKVRDQMEKYVCYYIGEVDDKYVLRVPADENKFLPYGVRPDHDIFFVMSKGDVELTGSAEQTGSSSSTNNSSKSSSAYELFGNNSLDNLLNNIETTANSTAGFEQQLNSLIEALPGNYENMKGDKIPDEIGGFMASDEWHCKVTLEGSEKTVVRAQWPGTQCAVQAYYPEYLTQSEALVKYRWLVDKIAKSKINCCTMVQSNEVASEAMTVTNWLTFGADGAYGSMVVEASIIKTFSFDKATYKKEDRWFVSASISRQK